MAIVVMWPCTSYANKQFITVKFICNFELKSLSELAKFVLLQLNNKCSIVSGTLQRSQRPVGWQPILYSWLFRQQAPNLSLFI